MTPEGAPRIGPWRLAVWGVRLFFAVTAFIAATIQMVHGNFVGAIVLFVVAVFFCPDAKRWASHRAHR